MNLALLAFLAVTTSAPNLGVLWSVLSASESSPCTGRPFLLSSAVPELPELEAIKARLRLSLAGRRIAGVTLNQFSCLKTVEPKLEALKDNHFLGITRFGKFLCLSTDKKLYLCIHLMLDGGLYLGPSDRAITRNHLLCLHLDNAEDLRVTENSTKHRVSIHLVTDPKQVPWIAELGLDPQAPEFTLNHFRQALSRRNRSVKKFLTDQHSVGGIGNCYSDEILYEARLSPFQQTGNLKPEEVIRLYTAVKKVLSDAILHLKALDHLPDRSDRTFLRAHGRLGQPCPACGSEIRRVSYEESTMYYCPGCQTGGNILADRRLSRLLK